MMDESAEAAACEVPPARLSLEGEARRLLRAEIAAMRLSNLETV